MEIGLIGLGKMGYHLALNFKRHGHQVLAYDISKASVDSISKEGIATASSVSDLVLSLPGRKVIWVMVPAGHSVDIILSNLKNHLHPNDIIIDGGNSHFKDSIHRAKELHDMDVHFLDCGTCGGVQTVTTGLSLTIGGNKDAFDYCEPIFQAISAQGGYTHCGPSGNGHFVKMVHNGIEYGMLQSIAEGMELLTKHNTLDVSAIAKVWSNGSLIESRLLDFAKSALEKDINLTTIKAIANHSNEGKWPAEVALDMGVPAPVITMALLMRYRSQQDDSFATRLVSRDRQRYRPQERAVRALSGA
jgi:6-phosphogluconate dehydrogenase